MLTHLITDDEIKATFDEVQEDVINFRRHIHAYPEVGWDEFDTTKFILTSLTAAGIRARRMSTTGVIADIEGGLEGAQRYTIGLRGDIDALPITETTGLPFTSQNTGVSHACGHDIHAASVYGAGLVLNKLKDKLPNNVRLIFQPAEEVKPSGSPEAIREGAMENVNEIYALHSEPRLYVGEIGVTEGAITSAADLVTVTVRGNGGHSSRPHLTADVIAALGAIVTNTSQIFSRVFDPRSVVSLTWGSIHAGDTNNVIPEVGVLKGTLRTTSLEAWESAEAKLFDVIGSIVAPYGAMLEIDYDKGVPPVINDDIAAKRMEQTVMNLFGPNALIHAERSLGGEDFSWYLREELHGTKVTGAMARLGTTPFGSPKNDIHQPNLVVSESAFNYSIPFLTRLAIKQV